MQYQNNPTYEKSSLVEQGNIIVPNRAFCVVKPDAPATTIPSMRAAFLPNHIWKCRDLVMPEAVVPYFPTNNKEKNR